MEPEEALALVKQYRTVATPNMRAIKNVMEKAKSSYCEGERTD